MSRRRGSSPGTRSFSFAVVLRRIRLTFFSRRAGQGPVARGPGSRPTTAASWTTDRDWIVPEEPTQVLNLSCVRRRPRAAAAAPDRLLHRLPVPVDGRVVAGEAVGQAHDPEGQALGQQHARAVGDDELGRAASDVHQEERVLLGGKLAAAREIDQPRLLLPGDDVHADPGPRFAPPQRIRPRWRPPAPRRSPPPARARRPAAAIRARCSTAEAPASIASGDSRPLASVSLPEPDERLFAGQHLQGPVLLHVGVRSLMLLVPMSIAARCLHGGPICSREVATA